MHWIVYSFTILCLFGGAKGCTVLTATETIDSFDSHEAYPNSSYSHNTLDCWIITADEGYVISAWTDDYFNLEAEYDYLTLMCGPDGDDGYIGDFTGTSGISSSFPVFTSGTELFAEFSTDRTEREDGFRLFFQAVNATEVGEDHDCDEYPDEDDHHYHPTHEKDYSGSAIGGIVFGVFVLICILGAITACVVCFVCSIKTRHKRIVQNYPLQMYPGTSGMTPVGHAAFAGPPMGTAMSPPAYSGAGAAPGAQQLYPDERKTHPDNFPSAEGPFSPPPSYEPNQTTGHY